MLLAGSDLISTMSEPGVWSAADVSEERTHHYDHHANNGHVA
jgi:hypothetical protein